MKTLHTENVSSFLDNEVEAEKLPGFLQALEEDANLQNKLDRYALIKGALKDEQSYVYDDAFITKVRDAMQYQPTVLAPANKRSNMPYITAAVAASFLALSVVMINVDQLGQGSAGMQTMAEVEQVNDIELALDDEIESNLDDESDLDTRFVTFDQE
ncbi:MAG: hypothetical protein A6F71_03970 [Cycloclasticus sp. symbiont of Poecilosclerida sp. M]|nr:MAG: hypothetical protein A6F71_03970 [Cycloclasticus sp. symbiont of Poecilosclerida sp. M]